MGLNATSFNAAPKAIYFSGARAEVMSACGKAFQWRKALRLFGGMQEALVKADVMSYGAAMSACEAAHEWQRVICLLEEMQRVRLEENMVHITSTMCACEAASQWARALHLFTTATEKLGADLFCFNALLSCCYTGRQWQAALKLYAEMPKQLVIPDKVSSKTFSKLIQEPSNRAHRMLRGI